MLWASTSDRRSTGPRPPPGRDREGQDVRRFEAFSGSLCALADWLKQCEIETVAMESTGVYWIALYELLVERGFEVLLVDARRVKNVPGRRLHGGQSDFQHAVDKGVGASSFFTVSSFAIRISS